MPTIVNSCKASWSEGAQLHEAKAAGVAEEDASWSSSFLVYNMKVNSVTCSLSRFPISKSNSCFPLPVNPMYMTMAVLWCHTEQLAMFSRLTPQRTPSTTSSILVRRSRKFIIVKPKNTFSLIPKNIFHLQTDTNVTCDL